jgi:hypothetical protein
MYTMCVPFLRQHAIQVVLGPMSRAFRGDASAPKLTSVVPAASPRHCWPAAVHRPCSERARRGRRMPASQHLWTSRIMQQQLQYTHCAQTQQLAKCMATLQQSHDSVWHSRPRSCTVARAGCCRQGMVQTCLCETEQCPSCVVFGYSQSPDGESLLMPPAPGLGSGI